MFISHKYRVIFVHIQRTGGNSIFSAFRRMDEELQHKLPFAEGFKRFKHPYASDIQQVADAELFSTYTKFAVVRNPFDRLVSWYSMFKHKTVDKQQLPAETNAEIAHVGDRVEAAFARYVNSFEDFVKLQPEQTDPLLARFQIPQRDFVCDAQGRLLMDKILHFEQLSEDFAALAQDIGFAETLPHDNASQRSKDYREYYTPELQAIVAERFKPDLELFAYHF